MADAGYLPPIVAQVMANIDDFVAKMAEVQAIGKEFEDTVFRSKAEVDTAQALTEFGAFRTSVDAEAAAPIELKANIDFTQAYIDLMTYKATAQAVGAFINETRLWSQIPNFGFNAGGGAGGAESVVAANLMSHQGTKSFPAGQFAFAGMSESALAKMMAGPSV